MEKFERLLKDIVARIAALEKVRTITNLIFPSDGTLILPKRSSDPTATTGSVYYNTTSHKMKVCENGVWKTVTTS